MISQRRRRRRAHSHAPQQGYGGTGAGNGARRVLITRGPGGFGFTISGQRPCVVSCVAADGPAERAGLRAGDLLMAVEGASVGRVEHDAVARLIAAAPDHIALTVAEDCSDTSEEEISRPRLRHPQRARTRPPRSYAPASARESAHRRRDLAPVSADVITTVPSGSSARPIASTSLGHLRTSRNISRIIDDSHSVSLYQVRASRAPGLMEGRLECRAVVGYLGSIEWPHAMAKGAEAAAVRHAIRKLRQERRSPATVLVSVLPSALALRKSGGSLMAEYARDRLRHVGCGSDADRRHFALVTRSTADGGAEPSHGCHVFLVDAKLTPHRAHADRARQFCIACTIDPVSGECLEFPAAADYVVDVIRCMYSLPVDRALQPLARLALGDAPEDAPRAPRRHRGFPASAGDSRRESPQPSNHSELTTASSNSDSGIGFHNDCQNVADRILVVDFARPLTAQSPPAPLRRDVAFPFATIPLLEGFGGVRPRVASAAESAHYDAVYTETEGHHHYESIGSHARLGAPRDSAEARGNRGPYSDDASLCSSRSHEEAPRVHRLSRGQGSLDNILLLSRDESEAIPRPHHHFLHPADVRHKSRASRPFKPLDMFAKKCKSLAGGRPRRVERPLSASVDDVCGGGDASRAAPESPLASSAPDLRDHACILDMNNEHPSPFRRWTTTSGAGASHSAAPPAAGHAEETAGGEAAAAGAGRVARWSLGLDQLLADSAGAAAFAAFLAKEFAAENIKFWWACERYAACEPGARRSSATELWARHLAEGAPDPVNVDADARRTAAERLHEEPPPADLFQLAQKQIFNLMKFDSYPRFLRSAVHAECARADLRGLPPPYEPPTPTRLKKSASNASERRRSGGSSLLPWSRSRAASKERASPADAVTAHHAEVPVACSLCRVVLPDGATSVVGVDAALSVRRLVERLLQRRAITCLAYDVLLQPQGGEGAPHYVDADAPSTVLGGRQATVERRCVFRLELGGRRAVGVRCRPGKRLWHVLRPVLARYAPSAIEPAVSCDGRPVPLDTRVQEVDGARLQVACVGACAAPPADCAELPDSLDPHTDFEPVLDASPERCTSPTDPAEAHRPGRSTEAVSIRAALRSGSPLHATAQQPHPAHHPPDLVDRVRLPQRARLLACETYAQAQVVRAAPPPLPPKPRLHAPPALTHQPAQNT